MGVVLFTMLSGSVPFSDDYGSAAVKQIRDGRFEFRSQQWRRVSEQARLLIKRMITVNVADRPTVLEVMADPWLQNPALVNSVNIIMKKEQQERRKIAEKLEREQENIPHQTPNVFRTPCAQQPPAKRQRIQ